MNKILNSLENAFGIGADAKDLEIARRSWLAPLSYPWQRLSCSSLRTSAPSCANRPSTSFSPSFLVSRAAAFAARLSPRFSTLLKGLSYQVIEHGQIIEAVMKKQNLTSGDVIEALRLHGGTAGPAEVAEASRDVQERRAKAFLMDWRIYHRDGEFEALCH